MATKKRRRKKGGDQGGGWRRSPITAVVALLVIALCVANLFMGGGDPLSRYKSDYVCTSCRVESRLPYQRGKSPFKCPDCSKKTLHSSLRCNSCKKVTASLPPLQDFSCRSCDYNGEHRFNGSKQNHKCPSCNKNKLSLTYECRKCRHYFPFQKSLIEGESGGFEMGEMPVLSCPKCNAQRGFPIDEEPQTSCEHCDSIELKAVTPIAVIKSELGRKLTSKEKRIVEEWEAEND